MRILTALATVALLAGQALAQDPGSLPVQQFAPAPGGDNNYVTVQGTGVLPSLAPAVGLYLNYAHDPLILRRLSNDEQISLIEHQVQADLIAALGLFDVLEIGLAIPVTLYQTQGSRTDTLAPVAVDSFTTGDIRIYPKVSILHPERDGFGISLLALVTLPTGSPENYQGNDSVTLEPRAVLEYIFSDSFRVGASVGFIWRPEEQEVFNIHLGNELSFGLGFEYKITESFGLILEGYGKMGLGGDDESNSEEKPLEVSLAGRIWPAKEHALTIGVARGLTDGYGSPDFRVYAGYNFTAKEDDDPDGDGIRGTDDKCPYEPEDFDGFEDSDGCADPDNDRDGIKDKQDDCPNEPEDYDGFEDQNGCPDPDNDGDGILDPNDKCPNEAEDKDGYADEDGCPDPDNDGDGILDGDDKCPLEPEDKDDWQDADGCPDPDNDGDGILDADDKCPNQEGESCITQYIPGCEIVITTPVFFKYDKDQIDEQKSREILTAVAETLKLHTSLKLLEVQGHTDSDGPDAYNLDLSQRRANAVKAWLTTTGGVDASRLTAKGYGETVELTAGNNKTPAGRAKNRRVQFIVLDPSAENCARSGPATK